MLKVIGVRFKRAGKIYYFDPGELEIQAGQSVIVETVRGVEFGDVVLGIKEIQENEAVAPLKKVIRVANDDDIKHVKENHAKEKDAFNICVKKIEEHGLKMKLIDVEYTFDNNKVIFYFTADGRIDFRDLVKDLASIFKTRIELRQIGVRDEAKMIGGIGPCGQQLCCCCHLSEFAPVSIKMAKEQGLSLNPAKISGICGRLMCCLKYEQEVYEEIRKKMPKVGENLVTPDGKGIVVENNILCQKVKIKLTLPDGTTDVREFPLDIIMQNNSDYKKDIIEEDQTDGAGKDTFNDK